MKALKVLFLLVLVLAALGLAFAGWEQYRSKKETPTLDPIRTYSYSPEVREAFKELPVQHGGRIKPMGSVALFQLLKLNGKRKLNSGGHAIEHRLLPDEWLLDVFFFPEQAKKYEVFVLDHKAIAQAIGLDLEHKKKRDRYSYNEIQSVRKTLFSMASAAFNKEPDDRKPLEKNVLNLWKNFSELEDLMGFAAFAEQPLSTSKLPDMQDVFGGQDVTLPEFLAHGPEYRKRLAAVTPTPAMREFFQEVERVNYRHFQGLGILAPTANPDEVPEWVAWPELLPKIMEGDQDAMGMLPVVEALGDAARQAGDAKAFDPTFLHFASMVQERAEARGEYSKVPMEVQFYKYDFFYRALYLFVLGFLLVCFAWLRPANKGQWLVRGSWLFTSLGLILLVTGITYRCIIRSRPPISTLYETILFIAAVVVITGLFLEWVSRKRMLLAVSGLLGAFGMFLAHKYELREAATAGDTMPALQAVLDTNFWLATHVTVINIGYAAGLLACALGHVWMIHYFFGQQDAESSRLTELARMIYGVLCFSLLFSVVGTILGGVWANDSWGRFWGWDPKENGALLICIWEILILHARMGGWIKNFGLAAMNILLGCVVAFSWWGVNLLNVGLHTYGFTEGVGFWLTVFYGAQGGIVLLALVGKAIRESQDAPTEVA